MCRRALVLFGVVLSVVAGACGIGSSGFRYVTNRKTGTYFKVPTKWKVYDQHAVTDVLKANGAEPPGSDVLFTAAFDSSPQPSLDHFLSLDPSSPHPSGMARVVALNDSQRDVVSFKVMRNLLLDVDSGVEQSQVTMLGQVDLKPTSGFRGQRIIYQVQRTSGAFVIDQSTLVDEKTQRLWVFAVGCETTCYKDQRKQIDRVVTSWTVKKR